MYGPGGGSVDEASGKHLRVLRDAHAWLAHGGGGGATAPRFAMLAHRHPSAAGSRPVAFLASFTLPGRQYIIPIKPGVNRIGRSVVFGDLAGFPSRRPLVEGRQWLIVCTPALTLVADDHSTNQSMVVPHDQRLLDPAIDPRLSGAYAYARTLERAVENQLMVLDWAGDITYALGEGDVLLGVYAGFVFGRAPALPSG